MLENAVYSVITPEGCAAILWKNESSQADEETRRKLVERAATYLRLTAEDLLGLGVIDHIVKEPTGGAHRSLDETCHLLSDALSKNLAGVVSVPSSERVLARHRRLRTLGRWIS